MMGPSAKLGEKGGKKSAATLFSSVFEIKVIIRD